VAICAVWVVNLRILGSASCASQLHPLRISARASCASSASAHLGSDVLRISARRPARLAPASPHLGSASCASSSGVRRTHLRLGRHRVIGVYASAAPSVTAHLGSASRRTHLSSTSTARIRLSTARVSARRLGLRWRPQIERGCQ
jgi:hypothetical protein